MSKTLARSVQASNRLPVLAAQIREDLNVVRQSAVEMAERMIAVGQALIEAKSSVAHGEWDRWLTLNVALSARSARRYMQLVKSGMETATVADLGLRAALEPTHGASGKALDQFVSFFVQQASHAELERIVIQAEAVLVDGSWPNGLALELLTRLWGGALPKTHRLFLEAIRADREDLSGGSAS